MTAVVRVSIARVVAALVAGFHWAAVDVGECQYCMVLSLQPVIAIWGTYTLLYHPCKSCVSIAMRPSASALQQTC